MKPAKVCPMCGVVFLARHHKRVYCVRCATLRDRECTRKWQREHPQKAKEYRQRWRAKNNKPPFIKWYLWDLINGYIEGPTFEYGDADETIAAEDAVYIAEYLTKHRIKIED